MKTSRTISFRHLFATAVLLAAGTAGPAGGLHASGDTAPTTRLDADFHLGGARTSEARYFLMVTTLTHFEEDGSRTAGATFRLWLEALAKGPTSDPGTASYVCRRFTVTQPGQREAELPTLGDWAYSFFSGETGIDEKGQVFGIPHQNFTILVDSRGNLLDSSTAYMVYNAFIDFHGLNDVFVARNDGGGVQDLRKIGDRVVHGAANTSPPVDLGEVIKKGSIFKNGEVTLELKGLSMVDGLHCALLGYDSGDSSYVMYLAPMPGMEAKAEGASHYFGDIYLELGSGWLRKGTLHEFVVSRMTSGNGEPNRSVIERTITLKAMPKNDFERW